MKLKKTSLVALLGVAAVGGICLQYAPPPPPPGQEAFESMPPIPVKYWVQKLATPRPDGSNVVMRIQYVSDVALPLTLITYQGSDSVIFHDDAVAPDVSSRDGIYSAYVKEDIPTFLSQVTALDNVLTAKGSFIDFQGHFGKIITNLPHFNEAGFNGGEVVELDPHLFNGSDCGISLKKENSLFITTLNVTEDLARTFNPITNQGTKGGCWTFGHMITGIVNDNVTVDARKNFLKKWLHDMMNTRTAAGMGSGPRPDVLRFLIEPWLRRVGYNPGSMAISASDWETIWSSSNISEQDLLDYAPFKLTAIANRIDLRGNSAYNRDLQQAGETRFIFTLVMPQTISTIGTSGYDYVQNTVPAQKDMQFLPAAIPTTTLDWSGMNIIFEYGNPQHNICDAQDFARSWLDLSSSIYHPFNTTKDEAYNYALAKLTTQVTLPGAGGLEKVNGSALNRIRTNEKIFAAVVHGPSAPNVASWSAANWELSQFELNPLDKKLTPVPVANTPQIEANVGVTSNNADTRVENNFPGYVPPNSSMDALRDWAFVNQNSVLAGNVRLPLSYTANGHTFTGTLTAQVMNEQAHYWDWIWPTPPIGFYPGIVAAKANDLGRNLRRQISLCTCQGCHSGETKTLFTQVSPMHYEQSADYWGAVPEYDQGAEDTRFVQQKGTSHVNGTLEPIYSMISAAGTANTHHILPNNPYSRHEDIYQQRVSAFLTGRKFNGPGDWADDNLNAAENASDNRIDPSLPSFPDVLYYVYDPTDNHDGTNDNTKPSPNGDALNGFNELERRKIMLCQFINLDCRRASLLLTLVHSTSHIPTGID